MAIFRGDGGSPASTTEATLNAVTEKANEAAVSAQNAETSEDNAATSATNAATSATNAAASATSAETAVATTTANANSAATSASNASTSASNALSSSNSAATSATAAATSSTAAATSATNSANSATSASTSATNAANSATTAATSETNATSSASAASTSAANAAASEAGVAADAAAAAASASSASTSETNAANSATSAASSATSATASATSATSSATAASTSASNAATSETNAGVSETNAAASESAAAASETNASTSETNAATSETNAATSANNAATSEANAAASFDSFDDRYLGAKASDPTLDNGGDALITGALYFNTTSGTMKAYNGSAWVDAYTSITGQTLDDVTTTGNTTTNSITVGGLHVDSTGAIEIPVGTTAQRPTGIVGYIRFNTEIDQLEQYTTDGWKGTSAPPLVTSTDTTNINEDDTTQSITITGFNFDSTASGDLIDANGTTRLPTTSQRNSSTSLTITYTGADVLTNAIPEPLDVRVTNRSGLSSVLEDQININATPVWTTTAGTLLDIDDRTSASTTVSATDADSDTLEFSLVSGAFPSGMSLNTTTGVISGTPNDVSSPTQSNFTLAVSDSFKTTDRSFNIIVSPKADGSTSDRAASSASVLGDAGASSGDYWFNIGGQTYQAYYYSGDGGGWNLLASFSNAPGNFDYWCAGGGSGNTYQTSETIIGQTSKVGTLTGLSQSNAKAPAFWSTSVSQLLFYVRYNGSYGWERYSVSAQTFQWMLLNSTASYNADSSSNRQTPFNGSFTFRESITNDGAFINTTGVSNEASGGIIANTDGAYAWNWAGNITRDDAGRSYNADGTTTDHTVWVFGR